MKINNEIIDDIHFYDIEGELGLYTVTEFKEIIYSCLDSGATKLILDFRSTTHIDSSGFALLFKINSRLSQTNHKLKVILDKKKTLLFQHFTMEKQIEIFMDKEPALKSFQKLD